jgi:Ca2+-binding EF-hand superfamily protein
MFFSAVMAGGAVAASAQEPPPPGSFPPGGGGGMRMQQMQMPTFADLDKNKDKKLSRDEFPSQMPQQFFDRMDENKDGFVDETEWSNAMSRFRGGAGGERVMMGGPRLGESLTKFLDGNSDAKVSREEFARMTELFDRLDADKNGELSQEELNGFFRAVNEAQNQATGGVDVSRLVQNLDKNKDGKITADETDEKTFRNLDLNKDGAVTKEEAEQALKKIAEQSKAKSSQATTPKNQ